MSNIDQKMKEFQSKSYDERLQIATNIITNLKDRGNVQAQQIFDIMSNLDKIPDNLIDAIYKDFCTSVDRIKQEKIEGELHSFDKSREHMNKIREQEAKERDEENPDGLLEGL